MGAVSEAGRPRSRIATRGFCGQEVLQPRRRLEAFDSGEVGGDTNARVHAGWHRGCRRRVCAAGLVLGGRLRLGLVHQVKQHRISARTPGEGGRCRRRDGACDERRWQDNRFGRRLSQEDGPRHLHRTRRSDCWSLYGSLCQSGAFTVTEFTGLEGAQISPSVAPGVDVGCHREELLPPVLTSRECLVA